MTYNPLILRVDKDGHLIVPEGTSLTDLKQNVEDRIKMFQLSSEQFRKALDRGEPWGVVLEPYTGYVQRFLTLMLEFPRVISADGKAVSMGGAHLFGSPENRRESLQLELRSKHAFPSAADNFSGILTAVGSAVRSAKRSAVAAAVTFNRIRVELTESGAELPAILLSDIDSLQMTLGGLIAKCSKTCIPKKTSGKGPGKHGWIKVREIAADFGVTPQTILSWEKNPNNPIRWRKENRMDPDFQRTYDTVVKAYRHWKMTGAKVSFVRYCEDFIKHNK